MEADCLLCHKQDYSFGARIQQINAKNYRWAATAGAGMGKVNGAVFTYADPAAGAASPDFMKGTWNFETRPTVAYNWTDRSIFGRDGRIRGAVISKEVLPANCRQCHAGPDAKKVGWVHLPEYDAHAKGGLRCTDCHGLAGSTDRERLQHNIAKGWHPLGSVRDDLDGRDMRTCYGCHLEGKYVQTRSDMPKKAKDPTLKHQEKFPDVMFHLDMIACATCHSTKQPAESGYLIDMSMGNQIWYTAASLETIVWSSDFGKPAPVPWQPWVTLFDARNGLGAQYIPQVPKVTQWFGEKMPNMEVRPITLKYVKKAYARLENPTTVEVMRTDGKKVKRPTLYRPEDILRMIAILTEMGFENVVYVADKVYESMDGKLKGYKDPLVAHAHTFPVHHNVVPVEQKATLGAGGKPNGCYDCHASGATFFTKMEVQNIGRFLVEDYPVAREPNSMPQMHHWGFKSVPVPEDLEKRE